jgi:parafibromin
LFRDQEFSLVIKLFNDKILKPKDQAIPSASFQQSSIQKDNPSKTPIIIVPNGMTSSITMLNAKEFLENGVFKSSLAVNTKKPKIEILNRKISQDLTCQYKLLDDASKLSNDEWDRVVAVFVSGQLWQFAQWKHNNPVDLFQNVLGVHLMFDDRNPDPIIQSWNCKVLKVQ